MKKIIYILIAISIISCSDNSVKNNQPKSDIIKLGYLTLYHSLQAATNTNMRILSAEAVFENFPPDSIMLNNYQLVEPDTVNRMIIYDTNMTVEDFENGLSVWWTSNGKNYSYSRNEVNFYEVVSHQPEDTIYKDRDLIIKFNKEIKNVNVSIGADELYSEPYSPTEIIIPKEEFKGIVSKDHNLTIYHSLKDNKTYYQKEVMEFSIVNKLILPVVLK